MRKPKLRVGIRGLMVVVAVAAGLLGWRQHRVYESLRLDYEDQVLEYGMMEKLAWANGNITQEEWLRRCREVDLMNDDAHAERSGGRRIWVAQPDPPEFERKMAIYYGRIKAKYERAARRPWLAVEPDEASPVRDWARRP